MRVLLLSFSMLLVGYAAPSESVFEIDEEKTAKYADTGYLKSTSDEVNGINVWVNGAVKNPGKYELIGSRSLLRLIRGAGGYTWFADETVDIIRTKSDGTEQTYRFSRKEDINDSFPRLHEGDVVIVSSKPPPDYSEINHEVDLDVKPQIEVSIQGAISKSGRYQISNGASIWDLIYEAGGLTPYARKHLYLARTDQDGEIRSYRIDSRDKERELQHFLLQDGDFIFCPATY